MSADLAIQTNPDGSVVTLDTVFLSTVDAELLGEYESWLSHERLSRQLVCRTCGPNCDVEAMIEPTQIGIACGHRLLLYQGHVPMRLTHDPHLGEPVTVERVEVPDVPISVADAFMLRRYQRFLNHHQLQEALWCLRCEDEGSPSGLKAYVQATAMVLLCRCRRRILNGIAA